MELTTGSIMFFGGLGGAAIGIILLFVLPGFFAKQRQKLLKKMENHTA